MQETPRGGGGGGPPKTHETLSPTGALAIYAACVNKYIQANLC